MSLMTLRLNEKRKNAFLSNCFNFVWLGKYRVDIFFSKNKYSVFMKNFIFEEFDFNIYHVESVLGNVSCKQFYNVKDAIDFFNLVCFTLISDFAIKSSDDFEEFFDLQRPQGFQEWLPELHKFLK